MTFKTFVKFIRSAIRLMINRVFIFGVSIFIQLVVLIVVIWKFNDYFVYFYTICAVLSAAVVLWLINNTHTNPSYKMAWIIPIMIFPIFGGLFYLLFAGNKITPHERKKMNMLSVTTAELLREGGADILREVGNISPYAGAQCSYLTNHIKYPAYKNTDVRYFPVGDELFEPYLAELERAEKFIFIEYFIIQSGKFWDSVLDILKRKAASGVDVRVIYDDFGCCMTLPNKYYETLEKYGIKAESFNRVKPILSIRVNNRDHRKITVIDGAVGFTGGINLADEYINAVVKHGHWKDTAIMLRGDAVWSLTVMFLSMWDYLVNPEPGVDYRAYRPVHTGITPSSGYVQPFTDSPLDYEIVGETVYMNMITRAKKYVYITTPYLIIDNEMNTALINAAKCGIDVRIITPFDGDKWYVQAVTRAHYRSLIENGVKIYEYTPGFIHAKSYVCDDEYAVVGTINMDYRSLYLHFENAVWMYRCDCIADIKRDFEETMSKSKLITPETDRRLAYGQSLLRAVLRVFAPLM